MPATDIRAASGVAGEMVGRRLPGARASNELRALLIGSRIDTRQLPQFIEADQLADGAGGAVFVFRYGVVALFGVPAEIERQIIDRLRPHVVEPAESFEIETVLIDVTDEVEEQVLDDGRLVLRDASIERLILTATVLARSVVLARDETQVFAAFDRIDPLVQTMRTEGRAGLPIRQVMRQIGEILATRHRLVGRAQISEKPDLLWDHPVLERLYARLDAEYELGERAAVIDRKLDTLGDTAEVLLDLVQEKRSVRLELAIIALIAFEIALTLYEKLVG